jgi:hypothetical protein
VYPAAGKAAAASAGERLDVDPVTVAAVAGSEFPMVVLAAAVLATEQVSGVLVGSAALWLRGEPVWTWIRANQHEDLPGSLTALENALASRRQKLLMAEY